MKDILWTFAREPDVTALGPGARYGLWVSGCAKRCPGCISPESHNMYNGKPIHISALIWEILDSDADEITISGGEPFLQAEVLAELLKKIRSRKTIGVIVYSGYTIEELLHRSEAGVHALLAQTDMLIDGEYRREENDGGALRGSANQRAVLLTERYRDILQLFGAEGRQIQQIDHAGHTNFIGIPAVEWK